VEKSYFIGHTDILCRLAPDLNWQDSESLILAHRCLFEPAWASPNVRFRGGVIHKRASPRKPSYAPAAQAIKLKKCPSDIFSSFHPEGVFFLDIPFPVWYNYFTWKYVKI